MIENSIPQTTVVKTERGLSIAGTRLTVSHVLDYLNEDWPPKLIRDWLNLTNQQITDVMAYIEANKDEVEAEYQEDLRLAAESRQYWEERNREHYAKVRNMPPKPGQEELREKLNAWKEKLRASNDDFS